MARGTQFLALQQRLRDELGRSDDVNIGVDDLSQLKRVINRAYAEVYDAWDWPHLRRVWPQQTLSAGQRYYDLPSGLNVERIECVNVWYSGLPHEIHRGIGFEEYASFDSDSDERSEPATSWDIRWTGTSAQIEIHPIPSSNTQTLQIIGFQAAPALVDDIDVCLVDDETVVLFAAAKFLLRQKSGDAEMVMAEARERLQRMKARTSGGGAGMTRVGLMPEPEETPRTRAVVRVR